MDIRDVLESLRTPNKNISPHKLAKGIIRCYESKNPNGLKQFVAAYVQGLEASDNPNSFEDIENVVRTNMGCAARLADIVADCGYEASGQLLVAFNPNPDCPKGKIYQFYEQIILPESLEAVPK